MSIREAEGTSWTIAEAKEKLPEILRLAEIEGPQRIGRRKRYIIVPEDAWLNRNPPPEAQVGGAPQEEQSAGMSISQYLLTKMPRGIYDNVPKRGSDPSIREDDGAKPELSRIDDDDPGSK